MVKRPTKHILAAAGAVVGVAPIAAIWGMAAASGTTTDPSGDGIRTQAQMIASGALTESSSVLPDGGTVYSYELASGGSFILPVPPSGFSPLTATPDQLATYGFPARPAGGTELQHWIATMSSYKSTVVPTLTFLTDAQTPTVQPASVTPSSALPASTAYASGNWSGYIASLNANDFIGVQGYLQVPTLNGTTCSNGRVTMWDGLGGSTPITGYGSGNLTQAGIDYNNLAANQWRAFYELIFSDASHDIHVGQDLGITQGDQIYMSTVYDPSTQVSSFFVLDLTKGQSQSFQESNSSAWYDGTSADVITEHFYPNQILMKYATFSWSNAEELLGDGNWKALNTGSNYKVYTSYGPHGDLTQYPGALNSAGTGFPQMWNMCS